MSNETDYFSITQNRYTGVLRGWVYEIAEYKAENLTKELSELLEDVQKPEQPEQVGEPNSVQ